jgi:hypothetical protein
MKRLTLVLLTILFLSFVFAAPALAKGKIKEPFECPVGEAVIGFDAEGTPYCSEIFPPEVPCPCWTLESLGDVVAAFPDPGERIFSETCTTVPVPVPESVEYRLDLKDPAETLDALTIGTVNGPDSLVNGDICHLTILGGVAGETESPIQCIGGSADILDCQYFLTDPQFDSCNSILRDYALNIAQIAECTPELP